MYGLDSIRRFQEGGFTDAQVAQYFAENPGLNESQIAEAMRQTGVSPEQVARVTGADPGYVSQRYLDLAPAPPPAVDPVAQKYVNDFNALINQGNYEDAARLVKSAELAGYGEDAYRAAAVALDANTNLPPELNFLNAEGIASIKSFVEQATKPPVGGASVTPLSFTDQLNALFQTNLGRLPTEREAAIYTKDFGGAFSPELQTAFLSRSAEEIANRQRGITKTADEAAKTEKEAAETAAANAEGRPGPDQILGIPRFERQTQSDLTFAPLRRGLAQLRPAMYMPGLTSGQAPLGGSGFTPESLRGAIQSMTAAGQTPADVANLMDVGGVSPAELSAAIGIPVGQIQAEYNQSRPRGLFGTGAPAPRGLPEDFVLQTGAYGAPTPTFLARPEKIAPLPTDPKPLTDFTKNPIVGYTEDRTPIYAPNPADDGGGARAGGIIKMAEGGMPRLSAEEAGSAFDIADYIDDEGRLVGGYSRPIYDENRVITGYDYRPYERDVVFGKELREKEAAMRLTDAEREQMMVEMAMRQGRTGISPTRGGLAGIEIGDPMMRRRPQYYSTVEESRPRYAEGGLASVAQNLADKGRKGDSMLVHMTPDEVAGLQALAQQMGGSLTINPQTGLPEANIFKKLLPMALGFALGPAGAGIFQSALTAGLAVGAGYTLATGSLQQGLSAGLSAYGGSNLGTGLQAAGAEAAAPAVAATDAVTQLGPAAGGGAASTALVDPTALHPDLGGPILTGGPSTTSINLGGAASGAMTHPDFGGSIATGGPSQAFAFDPMTGDQIITGTGGPLPGPEIITPTPSGGVYGKSSMPIVNNMTDRLTPTTPGSAITGAERYLGDKATRDLAAERYAAETGSTLGTSAMQIAGGMAGQSAADAEATMRAQQAAIDAKQDERKRRFDALFGRTLGAMPARSGGLMKLAGGGMTYMEAGGTTGPTGAPRDVTGTGDGMSDSVPASIEGVQEARLADGEFVIPADVVADIGNGSSDAGSKKLYDMMDRIRKARHGTTEQPPEIQAERLMPA